MIETVVQEEKALGLHREEANADQILEDAMAMARIWRTRIDERRAEP